MLTKSGLNCYEYSRAFERQEFQRLLFQTYFQNTLVSLLVWIQSMAKHLLKIPAVSISEMCQLSLNKTLWLLSRFKSKHINLCKEPNLKLGQIRDQWTLCINRSRHLIGFFLFSEKCTGENYIERKQKQKQNKTKTNQPTNPLLEEVLETT